MTYITLTLLVDNKYYRWFGYRGELATVISYLKREHDIAAVVTKSESSFVSHGTFEHGMRGMGHDPQARQLGTGQVVSRFVCTKCGKAGFHRNDGGHAYGNAIGNQCGTNHEIPAPVKREISAPKKKKRR